MTEREGGEGERREDGEGGEGRLDVVEGLMVEVSTVKGVMVGGEGVMVGGEGVMIRV